VLTLTRNYRRIIWILFIVDYWISTITLGKRARRLVFCQQLNEQGDKVKKKLMWRKNKLILKTKIFLGALVLLIVVYISTISYAVLNDDSDEPLAGQMSFFDPFTLRTIEPVSENTSGLPVSGSVITLPPIRIPIRPAIRSPFRPSWALDRQVRAGKP